jgi:hypothetical protein
MADALRSWLAGRPLAAVPTVAWAVLLGLIALAIRLPLILANHAITPGGDSQWYVEIAHSVAAGDGLGNQAYRTPGYPLLLLAWDWMLPGSLVDNAVVVQHVLGALLVTGAVLLTASWLGRPAALLAGAVLAVTPALPYLEHATLSDFPFALLAFAFAAALGRSFASGPPSIRNLMGVGALAAAAMYVRPVGQVLIVAVVLTTAYCTRSLRETVRATAVVALVAGLLVSPWILRNALEFGTVSMTTATGDTLFVRAFEVDKLPIPTDRPVGRLVVEVAASRGEERLVSAVTRALREHAGLGPAEALEAQESLARTAIWRNPWKYTVGTVEQIERLRTDPRDANIGTDVGPHIPSPPELNETIWDASDLLTRAWWTLSLGTVAGLLVLLAPRRRSRVFGAAMVATWLAVAAGTALGRGALTRYALELAPIAIVLGSFGAVAVVGALWAMAARGAGKLVALGRRASYRSAH